MKVKVHIHANFLCIFPERFSWKFAFDKQLHKYHVTKYFFFFFAKNANFNVWEKLKKFALDSKWLNIYLF